MHYITIRVKRVVPRRATCFIALNQIPIIMVSTAAGWEGREV